MSLNTAAPGGNDVPGNDLGPLAWVLDELRKSLDSATKALRRFVRDAEQARGSDLAEVDASQLRIARQQLHQAVGALEMVGMEAPAKVLRATEALAQKFVQHPELCSEDAARKVERASFALTEFLEGVLKGRTTSCVALFAQYRAVQELVSAERIHPADLWPLEWRWLAVPVPDVAAQAYAPAVRSQMDLAVLKLVKTGDAAAAGRLAQVCVGLAAAQDRLEPCTFWMIAAAYFEAMSLGLCPSDAFTKRAASRILQQYAALARGETGISDRLAQDLLFYCAQSVASPEQAAPLLAAVRQTYGLTQTQATDYESEQFGRYDPALLVLVRKRIASAAETWSALAGGDTHRLKLASEQFAALAETMVKLHPENAELAQALLRAIDATVRSGASPLAAVAMELATSVLYLEAAYEDLDPTANDLAERGARLAQRLQGVTAGGAQEPMESWMEDLYRRVSDRQTMGSVVEELRLALGEIEKSLDQFFREPRERAVLREVPNRLSQMRGVFSVLGLEQPSLASLRMRSSVEQLMAAGPDVLSSCASVVEKLGNSLGAMGFLVDMLGYQRALAKTLFVYDEDLGEFKPLMGRERVVVPLPAAVPPEAAPGTEAAPPSPATVEPQDAAPAPEVAPVPPAAEEHDEDDAELLAIFLEEAREVVQAGLAATKALASEPTDLSEQTTLRRAFHTLKGSSRMVGLNDFGEAAWSFEQLLNASLAEQRPASDELITLSGRAMLAFGRWVEDIANGVAQEWNAADFRKASDGLRLGGELLPLRTPGDVPVPEVAPLDMLAALPTPSTAEFASTQWTGEQVPAEEVAQAEEAPYVHVDFVATQVSDVVPIDAVTEPAEPQVDFMPTQTFDLLDEVSEQEPETLQQELARDEAPLDEIALDDLDFGPEPTHAAPAAPEPIAEQLAQEPEVSLDHLEFPSFGTDAEEPTPVAPELVSEHVIEAAPEVAPEPEPVPVPEPVAEVQTDHLPEPEPEPEPEAEAEATPLTEPEPEPEFENDEHTKVIGSLRLSIPLYNVYLNEADEWSRRLQVELGEWALELHKSVPDAAITLAHSLAGSSATVGFSALSALARALEHALGHVQLHRQGRPEYAQVFVSAAQDIRRLLHQFAAGFLKEPDAALLDALQAILDTEFSAVEEAQDGQVIEVDFAHGQVQPQVEHTPQPQAVPEVTPDAHDDAIDAVDRLDVDLFPIFEEEAAELLPQLGGALRQWVARPDNLSARSEVLRVLHTLKGSARLAGAMRLGEMAHRLESGVVRLGTESLQTQQVEPLQARFDALQANFTALLAAPASVDVAQPRVEEESDTLPPPLPSAPVLPTATLQPLRSSATQTVRVRAQLLDRLVNQAGEVMISRSRMEARLSQFRGSLDELGGNLERLRQQLRDVEVQAESQMQSRLAQTKDTSQAFDPLEFDRFTRLQELTRMMAESVNDVATVQRNLQRSVEGTEDDLIAQGRQARELQRDLLRTRMVEFEFIAERLYGVVRQAAKDTGKQVKLDIVGGNIEIDRGVLERMAPAFEHLLRNAVAHGIEGADARRAAGKPEEGSITIALKQESNDIAVTFSDDGAGLDVERIRSKAVAKGLVAEGVVLSAAEVANLVFMPGFSTAEQVTEVAGRGIGMDVVRSEVNALGGRIETASQPGQGTHFTLVLPLTTAVTQVVMLRMGEFTVGVPSNLVETVLRVPVAALHSAYQNNHLEWAGQQIAFFWAGALLQVSARSQEAPSRSAPIAVFRSAGQRLALHIDEVLGNREVVVKNLGPQLGRMPGLAGISVLASGAVALIYNPVALATVYGEQARQLRQNAPAPTTAAASGVAAFADDGAANEVPLVLVVDDSITVRRVTQRLLKREGYRVTLAADGLQALEKLQEEKPSVVLSDIEMPRMDGFDLARNIRNDARLRDLPIIMITSRIAEKHRDYAQEIGVDHYLGKPYAEEELLALVRNYCNAGSEV